jgi:hypothetical protein
MSAAQRPGASTRTEDTQRDATRALDRPAGVQG